MVTLADDLRLALDVVAFAERLHDPATGEPLVLEPWQKKLLRSGSKRLLLNCSRQSGKSTMAAIIALHRALYVPRSLILCLAPALRQSQELFQKIAYFYSDLGNRPVPAQAERKLSLELANGSRILTLPGTEKTIRGFSAVTLLIVDEASEVADGLYFAVRPMLAKSGGALIMLSTPKGKRGVFYEEWTNGEGWERYEVPASMLPEYWFSPNTTEYLAKERRTYPHWIYRQEYECSFEEKEDQVFPSELVRGAITKEVVPLFPGGFTYDR
jgi:phage terminase large subunit-like protein